MGSSLTRFCSRVVVAEAAFLQVDRAATLVTRSAFRILQVGAIPLVSALGAVVEYRLAEVQECFLEVGEDFALLLFANRVSQFFKLTHYFTLLDCASTKASRLSRLMRHCQPNLVALNFFSVIIRITVWRSTPYCSATSSTVRN